MSSGHHDHPPADDAPRDPEYQAAEYVALIEQALLERFPAAAHLRFSATVDGKFLTVGALMDAGGAQLMERAGKALVIDDVLITEQGQPRDVSLTVEDLLARAMLIYPYPVTAMPGVIVEGDGQYLLELTCR